MRDFLRPMLLMCLILAVPIVPFLAFGARFEAWAEAWREEPPAAPVTAAVVVGLLATDIFLPVPSSVISTLAGWQLGWLGGTLASWAGMSLGAVIGFALARRWGQRFAAWISRPQDLERMEKLSARYGPVTLILVRGVPVLAEASVLMVGMHRLPWRRFLPPVLLSNFGIALAYSAFGDFAQQNQWLPLALGVSIALPVLIVAVVRRWLPK